MCVQIQRSLQEAIQFAEQLCCKLTFRKRAKGRHCFCFFHAYCTYMLSVITASFHFSYHFIISTNCIFRSCVCAFKNKLFHQEVHTQLQSHSHNVYDVSIMFLENWKTVTKKCKHGFKCHSYAIICTLIGVSPFTSMSSEAFEG